MPTPRLTTPSGSPAEYIEVPEGGWSPDIPTWELPSNQSPLVENFQIKPGKLKVRPAFRATTTLTTPLTNPSPAAWVPINYGQSTYVKRLFVAGYHTEPRNIHRTGHSPPGSFITPMEQAHYEVTGNSIVRVAATTADQVISDRLINFNGQRYALAYADTGGSLITYNDGIGSYVNLLLHYDTFGSSPTIIGSTPVGGFDIYGAFNRIWIGGGIGYNQFIGGSILPSTTAVFFTNPIETLTGSPSDWTDPSHPGAGIDNVIDIDGDHTDPIVGLSSVPQGLIVFRQNSVFIIRSAADVTNSGTVRPVSQQTGCLDVRSICPQDNKVYFMGQQGLMVTDGTGVQNISGPLQDELYRQIATWNDAVYNGAGGWVTITSMSDNKLLVSIGISTIGNSTINYPMQGTFSGVFDTTSGAWVKISTLIAPVGGSNTLGPTIGGYDTLMSLGNGLILTIEDTRLSQLTTSASSLYDQSTPAGAKVAVQASWATRSPQLGLASRTVSTIKRVYLDYAVSTGGPDGTVFWGLVDRMQLSTPSFLRNVSIPASTASVNARQYLQRDDQHEVADAGFNVVIQGSATPTTTALTVPKAEIHGIGVDFMPGQDLRPTV